MIVIATAIHSFIYPTTQQCINSAAKAHGMGILEPEIGNSDIAAARTYLARKALAAGATGILWVDADMLFTVNDVAMLIFGGHGDVRGTNYWTRDGKLPTWRPVEDGEYELGASGRVYPAHSVGFGLTYTGPNALALAAQAGCPQLPFEDQPPGVVRTGPHWFKQLQLEQEDGSFCARVTASGGTVTVDTRICPGHLEPRPVYWWSRWLEAQAPKSGCVPLRRRPA
jgi:hypothetical protein